jgi:hypothetical protein
MPLESRRFAKAALIFLLLTFLAGAAFTVARGAGVAVPAIFAVEHGHAGFVGFLVNIVIGVALWMLPLNRDRYPNTQGRYPQWAPTLCFWLLNGGLAVRLVAEPLDVLAMHSSLLAMIVNLAAIVQVAAVVIFVAIAWQRVRGPTRPAPGVR